MWETFLREGVKRERGRTVGVVGKGTGGGHRGGVGGARGGLLRIKGGGGGDISTFPLVVVFLFLFLKLSRSQTFPSRVRWETFLSGQWQERFMLVE